MSESVLNNIDPGLPTLLDGLLQNPRILPATDVGRLCVRADAWLNDVVTYLPSGALPQPDLRLIAQLFRVLSIQHDMHADGENARKKPFVIDVPPTGG